MAFQSVPTTLLFGIWSVWHQRTLTAKYECWYLSQFRNFRESISIKSKFQKSLIAPSVPICTVRPESTCIRICCLASFETFPRLWACFTRMPSTHEKNWGYSGCPHLHPAPKKKFGLFPDSSIFFSNILFRDVVNGKNPEIIFCRSFSTGVIVISVELVWF